MRCGHDHAPDSNATPTWGRRRWRPRRRRRDRSVSAGLSRLRDGHGAGRCARRSSTTNHGHRPEAVVVAGDAGRGRPARRLGVGVQRDHPRFRGCPIATATRRPRASNPSHRRQHRTGEATTCKCRRPRWSRAAPRRQPVASVGHRGRRPDDVCGHPHSHGGTPMSPHNAIKHGADVLTLVAFDRGREKHTGGGAPAAGRDHPSWPRTSAQVQRQSRAGQLRGLRQHFYRQAVNAQADQPLRVLAYSLVPSPRALPDEDWGTLQAEADQLGYAIAARLHDVAVPVTTTYFPGIQCEPGRLHAALGSTWLAGSRAAAPRGLGRRRARPRPAQHQLRWRRVPRRDQTPGRALPGVSPPRDLRGARRADLKASAALDGQEGLGLAADQRPDRPDRHRERRARLHLQIHLTEG